MHTIAVINKRFMRPLGYFQYDPTQLTRLSAGIMIKTIVEVKPENEILEALAKEGITPIDRDKCTVEVNDDGAMKFFGTTLDQLFNG